MTLFDTDILARKAAWEEKYSLRLLRPLGVGREGSVWAGERGGAVKFHGTVEAFAREVSVYMRLLERSVIELAGFSVPMIESADVAMGAIQMWIVAPPFVLDFSSAYLDASAPVFSEDAMLEWLHSRREIYGDDWPRVAAVVARLRALGIHFTDVHPGNIRVRNDVPQTFIDPMI